MIGQVALGIVALLFGMFAVACFVPLFTGEGLFIGIGGVLLGLLVGGFAVFLGGVALGKWEFESDPCAYTIMAGKTPIVLHHEGWHTTGGREVWCGPGPVPNGEPR